MKHSIFLTYASLVLTISMVSLYGQGKSNTPNFDEIFIVAARDHLIEILNDRAEIHTTSSDPALSENAKSLKKAWKQCYGSMLLGQNEPTSSFFPKGLPRDLQLPKNHDGKVKVLLISQVKDSIRLILKIEIIAPNNGLTIIYDAHTWKINDKGEWEVESTIYQ